MYIDWLFWSRVYHVLLPCSEFTVSAIKRSQLCLLVSSRLLFSPNTTKSPLCRKSQVVLILNLPLPRSKVLRTFPRMVNYFGDPYLTSTSIPDCSVKFFDR